MANSYKPEWVPENGGAEFASKVMQGVADIKPKKASVVTVKPSSFTSKDYVDGILAGDRMLLSRAITLIESNAAKHFDMAQEIVQAIVPYAGKAVRVGITGVPGAGKSTFIEALGSNLCEQGKKIAVLAVDPSSTVSRGSVLGDKTRMENLARQKNAYIRPSPSGGTLGGVTRKSRETMLLCEAAGYDTILVETVGVGQGETTVRSMVDFFLLVTITGAGDELQGIKKGIIELADAILVNKCDGSNVQKALATKTEYNQILHYLRPATDGWTTKAYTCSAYENTGINEIWSVIEGFFESMSESGKLAERRTQQRWQWVQDMVWQHIHSSIASSEGFQNGLKLMERRLLSEDITATMAAKSLIEIVERELGKD